MTFLSSLQNFITETESDVEQVIADIKAGETLVASELAAAQHWIAANVPTITADVQMVLQLIEAFGVVGDPEVGIAIGAANAAVTALNAFASTTNAGGNAAQAVVSGYVAVKQATAAVNSAKAVAAAAPSAGTPTPAAS